MYLPVLWEQSFCWKNPLVLGYTRGHFSALVSMETDNSNELGAGANVDSIDSVHVTYLPLVDYEGKLLPVHFLSAEEVMSCLVAMPHRKLKGGSISKMGMLKNHQWH